MAFALNFAGAAFAQAAPDALRVCADPDNLPYSRADGSGFENRIAQTLADDLKLPLQYEWLPDRRGFVRKTLGEQKCDLIVGVPAQFERTANTRPYYRSTYVFVERATAAPPVHSLDDPRLPKLRIGVQLIGNDLAASPPGELLARHGHTQNVRGFTLAGETPSAERAVDAIVRGDIDAAVLWGPQAAYFARRAAAPLRVTKLQVPADAHFEFAIAMGVRRGDKELRERLDDFIRRRQADIDVILAEYEVPQ
ncbi:quinoprotein dehydrogenase-associated putative ABC transporter substrate-binding protein [Ramlibacter sp. PS4R-6]|uniref:quinoprotein dehydrogenase-associated putative ABC transporter substrate-binding protein n=1 Tax=Ramlibacter sp. PS4R-6 TaxID=3133438 RepID=UPI0030B2988C